MIEIVVTYLDGKHYACGNVQKVTYNPIAGEPVIVEGAAIAGHHFPLGRTLWVHTVDGVCTISGENVRAINVVNG